MGRMTAVDAMSLRRFRGWRLIRGAERPRKRGMNPPTAWVWLTALATVASVLGQPAAQTMTAPLAAPRPHSFTHHGITIEDPWHWLRDPAYPKVKDKAILDYLKSENRYFEAQMKAQQPLVDMLFQELKGGCRRTTARCQ